MGLTPWNDGATFRNALWPTSEQPVQPLIRSDCLCATPECASHHWAERDRQRHEWIERRAAAHRDGTYPLIVRTP